MSGIINPELRGFLSWKACAGYLLFSGFVWGASALAYRNERFAPVVWTGTCEIDEPSKDNGYAICDANGTKIRDSIPLKLMYASMHDHKPLICEANTLNDLTCHVD